MTLEIGVSRNEQDFELPAWRLLLARDPDRHIFATPEWHRLWWDEFGANKELNILTMARRGEIAAIVPLYRREQERRKFLRFVGGIDLTDYLGPICSPDDRYEVAGSLVDWLAATDVEWDEFDGHCLPVPLGFADFLVDHADRRSFPFAIEQEEVSARLVLPSDWDSYLELLSSKERHELKRKRRRLGRDHPDAVVRRADEETLERDLKYFIEMHRGTEGHKGHFMKPEVATFFERIGRAFMDLGWLRLDLLEVGGRPIASTFSFELDGVFYLYNSAYEPDAARLSPGVVLVAELVKSSIESGLRIFDFLRGPERYKYQFGALGVPLNKVRIFPRQRTS